jgi:membrane associated rhomboid family serine protease
MEKPGILGLVLVISTFIISYQGIRDRIFYKNYSFEVDSILKFKEYKRLLTSAFLHVGWLHLLFNLTALYSFSEGLEHVAGISKTCFIYFISLLAGNFFALYVHRNHGDYNAAGASGGISGLIFAVIALFPSEGIRLLFLPFSIPGWLFGIVYVLVSIYGIKRQTGNIGHEAHLGGGLAGMVAALVMYPGALSENFIVIIAIIAPAVVYLFFIFMRPEYLILSSAENNGKAYTMDDIYNSDRVDSEKEIDEILDKINKKGIKSLTRREREKLDRHSQLY